MKPTLDIAEDVLEATKELAASSASARRHGVPLLPARPGERAVTSAIVSALAEDDAAQMKLGCRKERFLSANPNSFVRHDPESASWRLGLEDPSEARDQGVHTIDLLVPRSKNDDARGMFRRVGPDIRKISIQGDQRPPVFLDYSE